MKESAGLGLLIDKKRSELLKAGKDIDSATDKGSLVWIRFLAKG